MDELLTHPAVQGGLAPLLVALVVAGCAYPLRLSGLAIGAGFAVAVYLTGTFAWEPLTAMRKIVLVGLIAAAAGTVADLAFKPTRAAGAALGVLFGLASAWVFWSVLKQKPPAEAALYAIAVAVFVAWTVGFTVTLHGDPARAGAAALAMGLGTGVSSIFGATALIGLLGLALGAAAGAFLLLVMILGKRMVAGASLTLAASVTASLLAAGAMLLAKLPWYSLAVLALIPIAVRLPMPQQAHARLRTVVACVYGLAFAGGACLLAWKQVAGRIMDL